MSKANTNRIKAMLPFGRVIEVMKTIGVILLAMFTVTAKICCAQTASTLMGARTTSLGNSSAAIADTWSGLNNPAGLGWLSGAWIAATNDRAPALPGANRVAFTTGTAGKPGGLSTGAFRFGDNVYNEQTLNLSGAHRLGLASIGARVDLIQYRADGFEPVVGWGLTIGTRAQMTDRVAVGGYATNITRAEFPDGRSIPVRVAAGFEWRPSTQVAICGELEKIAAAEPIIKSGLELSPLKKVKFRTGLNLFPYALYAGFGLRTWKVTIDYAFSFSYVLSYSHQVSIELSTKRNEK